MASLPRPWHAAYDWIDAAGELPTLIGLSGTALDDFARACVDNFSDNPSGEGFVESDVTGLRDYLVAHIDDYPRITGARG